jgi:hypothetical protein
MSAKSVKEAEASLDQWFLTLRTGFLGGANPSQSTFASMNRSRKVTVTFRNSKFFSGEANPFSLSTLLLDTITEIFFEMNVLHIMDIIPIHKKLRFKLVIQFLIART